MKDFPANEKAYEVKLSRGELIRMRIFVGCMYTISICFIAFILVMDSRRSNRIEIQQINEKTLKTAPIDFD